MGILRLYLALCVVAAHAGASIPWRMHDGRQAVQIFYIISGFYMALVLTTRYADARSFYASRFMRIFLPYWLVLAGTVVCSVVAGLATGHWLLLESYLNQPLAHNGVAGLLLTAVSNLTLLGQDWILFLTHEAGHPLQATADFKRSTSPLWHYLLVPQCWSIGLELTFYSLAPFLNRVRTRWLASLAVGAFGLRFAVYAGLYLDYNPWTYRFFPFEIGLFLLGMLGYRIYSRWLRPVTARGFFELSQFSYVLGSILLLVALYLGVSGVGWMENLVGHELSVLITYPVWGLAGVPLLFFWFGGQTADRLVGELSYPIYLLHYLITAVLSLFPVFAGERLGQASALVSLLLAGLFYWGLIAPLDRKRHVLAPARAAAVSR